MYDSLKLALAPFQVSLDLDDEQRKSLLLGNFSLGYLQSDKLKRELQETLEDQKFDWVGFASEIELLINPITYSQEEVKDYVKFCLFETLWPKYKLSNGEKNNLTNEIAAIISEMKPKGEWTLATEVFQAIKAKQIFEQLEYFQLWQLDFIYGPIERKPIAEKWVNLGYLRNRPQGDTI